LILRRFEDADVNKDGVIKIDGFKSAMLIEEVNKYMKIVDIEEAFYLSENKDREINYRTWIKEDFPHLV